MNAWHKLSVTEAVSLLATDVEQGLSVNEAKDRLARYGQNKLRKGKRFSALVIFGSQFKSLVIWVLMSRSACLPMNFTSTTALSKPAMPPLPLW